MKNSFIGFALTLLIALSHCEVKIASGIQSGYAYEKDKIEYDLSKVFDLSSTPMENFQSVVSYQPTKGATYYDVSTAYTTKTTSSTSDVSITVALSENSFLNILGDSSLQYGKMTLDGTDFATLSPSLDIQLPEGATEVVCHDADWYLGVDGTTVYTFVSCVG